MVDGGFSGSCGLSLRGAGLDSRTTGSRLKGQWELRDASCGLDGAFPGVFPDVHVASAPRVLLHYKHMFRNSAMAACSRKYCAARCRTMICRTLCPPDPPRTFSCPTHHGAIRSGSQGRGLQHGPSNLNPHLELYCSPDAAQEALLLPRRGRQSSLKGVVVHSTLTLVAGGWSFRAFGVLGSFAG